MRRGAWVILLASLGIAAVIAAFHGAAETLLQRAQAEEGSGSGGLPPLKVDKAAPLLLAEPEEPEEPDFFDVPPGPMADNTACFVCHTNYEEEPFAVVHAKANVGCMKCHGKSLAHRDDEDNITPPETMFAPEKIQANCDKCHDEHDAPAVAVIKRWQERCPAKTDPKDILCTDCHGKHRLKIRTVLWDKNTGKLIVRRKGKQKKAKDDPAGKKPKTKPGDEKK